METKVCKVCGRELPIEQFAKTHFGVSHTCTECRAKLIAQGRENKKKLASFDKELEAARNARLADFTPRELMTELARRGYEGKLTYTRVEEIDINNF